MVVQELSQHAVIVRSFQVFTMGRYSEYTLVRDVIGQCDEVGAKVTTWDWKPVSLKKTGCISNPAAYRIIFPSLEAFATVYRSIRSTYSQAEMYFSPHDVLEAHIQLLETGDELSFTESMQAYGKMLENLGLSPDEEQEFDKQEPDWDEITKVWEKFNGEIEDCDDEDWEEVE